MAIKPLCRPSPFGACAALIEILADERQVHGLQPLDPRGMLTNIDSRFDGEHALEDLLAMEGIRVFILGAGFSKPAGFPVATQLTEEVLNEIRKLVGDEYELFELADAVRQLHRWIMRARSMPLLNIEEFYDYATTFAERFRFEQHLVNVDRDAGETPFRKAQDIETWLSYLDEDLLDVLLRCESSADLGPIARFADSIGPTDTIVTFNYDRLVERTLIERGAAWTFGFSETQSDAAAVLKVHGSMDWICLARDQHPEQHGLKLLFSKPDIDRERNPQPTRSGELEYDFELYQITDDERLRGLIDDRALIQAAHFWGLAGLGPQKRVSRVPGLGVVWAQARRHLFDADQIVIVGFSFSGYDRLAQIEFARVMAGREESGKAQPHILVVDPLLQKNSGRMRAGGRALLKRLESVFRPVDCIGAYHEDVDWENLGS